MRPRVLPTKYEHIKKRNRTKIYKIQVEYYKKNVTVIKNDYLLMYDEKQSLFFIQQLLFIEKQRWIVFNHSAVKH